MLSKDRLRTGISCLQSAYSPQDATKSDTLDRSMLTQTLTGSERAGV